MALSGKPAAAAAAAAAVGFSSSSAAAAAGKPGSGGGGGGGLWSRDMKLGSATSGSSGTGVRSSAGKTDQHQPSAFANSLAVSSMATAVFGFTNNANKG